VPRLAVPELRSLPFSLYPPLAGSAATEALSARLKSQRQIDTAPRSNATLPAAGPSGRPLHDVRRRDAQPIIGAAVTPATDDRLEAHQDTRRPR
jgi:hypothetical protein